MRVNEIFYSLQGEGMLVGTPSVFVRLSGCPFRCRWCDTAYAWDYAAGEEFGLDEIVEQVNRWPCRFIVLTGGEPLAGPDLSVRPGLADLTHRLRALGKHITIETAGALFVPDLACDLMSISPKLTNSLPQRAGAARREKRGHSYFSSLASPVEHLPAEKEECPLFPRPRDWGTVRQLMDAYPYQLKFVVESAEDVQEARRVLGRLGEPAPERVLLMPQAMTTEELLRRSPAIAQACKETGLRFGQRLHLLLWDRQRGV